MCIVISDYFHEPHVSTLVHAYYPGSLGGIERGERGVTCPPWSTNFHYHLYEVEAYFYFY